MADRPDGCNFPTAAPVCGVLHMPSMTRDAAADAALGRELGTMDARLRAFLGSLGRCDVDELAQETMARAWRSRASFDAAKGTLAAWLLRIAFRVFLDRRGGATHAAALVEPADHRTDPARAAEVRDHTEALLARLSPPERDVLLRFHRDGDSIADIARSLAMPAGTVKSHLHRARNRMLAFEREHDSIATRRGAR